ncbi:MAG: rRNA maturation RNase YbeY [Candidatus Marinimicrobia bacterium]|nr:rRNA maturation RNase YbeY [Candidatus Neomarinimicrobiota bacterium]|tara:strand:+ start:15306 stop:15749 length:444 start_codon:yes stop_codon:yes gene_type:complete
MIQYEQNCDPQLSPPQKDLVEKIVQKIFSDQKVNDGDISIIFGSDELLKSLKNKFFNLDHFTDVIAFRLNTYNEKHIDGEIYISLPRAKENSIEFEEPFEKEVSRLIIHGCLHLIGFNDDTEKKKEEMHKIEDAYLSFLDWEYLFGD